MKGIRNMIITTAFDIGDILYIAQSQLILNKNCPFCGGEGTILCSGLNKKTLASKCPQCNGTGNVLSESGRGWSSKEEYRVREMFAISFVRSVKGKLRVAKIEWDGKAVVYRCDVIVNEKRVSKDFVVQESKCFRTYDACQKWCEEQNKAQIFD